ncbi:uncharacterized protein C8R40DRAFT_1046018, partial [Lentinula edodes]|uniref:uncharacterized protein n=1 Tax=Lentinula edodes TaxID=5353 RepID=UPI001E8DEE51
FVQEVWAWWANLQPDWRSLDENGLPMPFEEFGDDLSSLNKHGRNAWVGLLACLKWWKVGLGYHIADDNEAPVNEWLAIIADMTRMLDRLVAE